MRPFGELEAAIMDVFWSTGTSKVVREVVAELAPQRPLAYTTVMTVTENLHRKGWLNRERDGRAWRYSAALSRDTYTAQAMSDALSGSDDRAGALARFVEEIDTEDAQALSEVLAQALAQRTGRAAK
jgi:predicted transcriptional regulator